MTPYYPKSVVDASRRNFRLKRETFATLEKLIVVTPSDWMRRVVSESFFAGHDVRTIKNGVDLGTFCPADSPIRGKTVLGVANVWNERKGLRDFVSLRDHLPPEYDIVLVGVNPAQKRQLPMGIQGVPKTAQIQDLVQWYQRAMVFVNPTYSDTFPTTNIESLACGTPVITYNTGGSPEAIDSSTGQVVKQGDVKGLAAAIRRVAQADPVSTQECCRKRAEAHFDQRRCSSSYVELFESLG